MLLWIDMVLSYPRKLSKSCALVSCVTDALMT